ncbi:MAG TPA: GntR family transcriptional regulator [Acidimicrobiales bacterium]|nr:GntR family transcriptional regulator [Acidimicrobiales bacterium]
METAFDNITLSERVYRHLRAEIRGQRLPPGVELSEVALSKELGVSRGPIREAMGRLAAEGLVTVRPRRGAVVRALTAEEFVDAYQVREVLESTAVRLAVPRLTKEDFEQLEQLVDTMADRVENGRLDEFFEANMRFHELFCELSGNGKLSQVHHALLAEMGAFQDRTLSLRGNPAESVIEHRNIVRAAERGEAELAAELAAAHVRVPSERLRDRLVEMAVKEANRTD